jgi:hypothetical protein
VADLVGWGVAISIWGSNASNSEAPRMDSLCTEENGVANQCCVVVGDRKYLGYAGFHKEIKVFSNPT